MSMNACMLANACLALTVAEHAETGVDALLQVVVELDPGAKEVVVGLSDRATSLPATTVMI